MLLCVLLLAAATPQTLPQVQEQLEKERAAAAQLAGRESTLLGRLAEVERQVEVELRAWRAAQGRLRATAARLSATEAKSRAAEGELARATDALGPRLTARYKMGREGYLRFLLGARSIGEVLRRRRLFDAVLESDLDALAGLRFAAQGAKAARDELVASRKDLVDAASAESERRSALEAKVAAQKRVLASVQEEKAAHEQAVRELEEAARELGSRLSELEKSSPTMPEVKPVPKVEAHPELKLPPEQKLALAGPIRKARGKLLFPADAGRIEVRFGRTLDPRFGTVTLQRGIDVRAPTGTPVRAVHDGKVVHAGWFKGYGNLVIVDHGEGFFSLMAHLASLDRAVGDVVSAGDQVGTVGDTGSLKGAYLYFELRDGQKPLDPERWLLRRRKGISLLAGKAPAR